MASISQRQVEFLKSQFLNSLGTQRPTNDLSVLEGILKQYAQVFLMEAIENLNKTNSIATGNIADDLTFTVEEVPGSYILSIGYPPESNAAKYYDFVNKGVSGVQNPTASPYAFKTINPSKKHVKAIEDWLLLGKSKVQATDVARYSPSRQESKSIGFRQVDDSKSLAYVIARSIKKKGIKATNFFDDAISTVFNDNFRLILSEALAADVQIQLTNTRLN